MVRQVFLAAAVVLSSCSPEVPAPPPMMSRKPAPQETLPTPPAATPVPPPKPVPPVEPRKPDPTPEGEVYRAKVDLPMGPPRRQEDPPVAQNHLPAFTFRTMDHARVDVAVNGDRIATTSCLWSICETIEFDPKIPVTAWPPPGAKFVGSTRRMTDNGAGEAELWIASAESVRAEAPHLRADEHVLYVKGKIGRTQLQGALRLYVGMPTLPYRYTDYNPVMDMESESASRFMRTAWFEASKN